MLVAALTVRTTHPREWSFWLVRVTPFAAILKSPAWRACASVAPRTSQKLHPLTPRPPLRPTRRGPRAQLRQGHQSRRDNATDACPRITSPVCNRLGVGTQPPASRASSSSSAVGRWSQTETPFTAPSHVVSNTRNESLPARTSTSCVYSSWITTSSRLNRGSC